MPDRIGHAVSLAAEPNTLLFICKLPTTPQHFDSTASLLYSGTTPATLAIVTIDSCTCLNGAAEALICYSGKHSGQVSELGTVTSKDILPVVFRTSVYHDFFISSAALFGTAGNVRSPFWDGLHAIFLFKKSWEDMSLDQEAERREKEGCQVQQAASRTRHGGVTDRCGGLEKRYSRSATLKAIARSRTTLSVNNGRTTQRGVGGMLYELDRPLGNIQVVF